jgi:hypothetical protein
MTSSITKNLSTGIDDVCGRVDYDEAGEGLTVALVPGSCGIGAACTPRGSGDALGELWGRAFIAKSSTTGI